MQIEPALGEPESRSVVGRKLLPHESSDHLGERRADLEAEILLEGREVQALGEPQAGEEPLAKVLVAISPSPANWDRSLTPLPDAMGTRQRIVGLRR